MESNTENITKENSTEQNGFSASPETQNTSSKDSIATGEQEKSAPESSVIELLKEELEKAKKESESFKESWQRERAEFQNYKRRTSQELLNARNESIRSFVSNLLNPLDNLERVVSQPSPSPEVQTIVQGIGMIQKEISGILERQGYFKLEAKDQEFDPMFMEAIAMEESEAVKLETVVEVYQSGYYFKNGEDKIGIRPARVRIAKPKEIQNNNKSVETDKEQNNG